MNSLDDEWIVVDETPGPVQAEILCGLLESSGIKTQMSQESAGLVFATSFGILGTTKIFVLQSDYERAHEVVEAFYSGNIGSAEENETDNSNDSEEDSSDEDDDSIIN